MVIPSIYGRSDTGRQGGQPRRYSLQTRNSGCKTLGHCPRLKLPEIEPMATIRTEKSGHSAEDSGLAARLRREITGDVFSDPFNRGRYATDASFYQIIPLGAVVPRTMDEALRTLAIAREAGRIVTPRGGGTSQCGQTVNEGIVVDFSKHLNRVLSLDLVHHTCVVEPGIVLDDLNRQLRKHGLWFPVDVSTASRATIGGMAGNNSC